MIEEKDTTQAGVYMIRCTANGKVYVGSTYDCVRRESQHRSNLNKGKHYSRHLQNAWNKYGADAFVWSVLEYVPLDGLTKAEAKPLLLGREQHYIDVYDTVQSGFNQRLKAESNLGIKYSAEAIATHAEGHRRKYKDPAYRAKHAAASRRLAQDPAWIANHAESHRRLAKDPAWQAKNAEAMRRNSRRRSLLRAVTYMEQMILTGSSNA
jgi:group I intron endonuclease